jgi:hypothetical protein
VLRLDPARPYGVRPEPAGHRETLRSAPAADATAAFVVDTNLLLARSCAGPQQRTAGADAEAAQLLGLLRGEPVLVIDSGDGHVVAPARRWDVALA